MKVCAACPEKGHSILVASECHPGGFLGRFEYLVVVRY